MHFSEKLYLLRKSKGYTQEKLAEQLNVSRQAVTKWESGLSYPDINNLVQISNLMHVTIDYLVRVQENNTKPVKNTIKELDDLIRFKTKASKTIHAPFINEAEGLRLGSHDYRYEEGIFVYTNKFFGTEQYSGEEIIYRKDRAIFAMNYMSHVIKDSFHEEFLREALHATTIETPYRGPELYQSGEYIYKCKVFGNITWFQGYEDISRKAEKVYKCCFHGGVLR